MERVEPSKVQPNIQSSIEANVAMLPGGLSGAPDGQTAHARSAEQRAFAGAPGSPSIMVAALFTLFWVGGISAYLFGYYGEAGADRIPASWWGILTAVLLVPTAMAWFIAMVLRESRQLRAQAHTLATTAAALMQPDDHAARGVARLGKTLRRELDHFNMALEAAMGRMAQLETVNAERLTQLEHAAREAQDRVERASGRLGSEREKFATFTATLEHSVLQVNESLNARIQEARAAARVAADSLQAEQTAILGLIETLKTSAAQASTHAGDAAKEIERQAQRLDSAAEAATARSEQVMARHERHRAALTETLERLRGENDHMTKALESQRDAFTKLTLLMGEEAKRIDAFANDGLRRIDSASQTLTAKIDNFAADSIQRMENAAASLTRRMADLTQSANQSLSGATMTMEARMGDLKSVTAQTLDAASAALETRLADLRVAASQSLEEAVATVETRVSELQRTAVLAVDGASAAMSQRVSELNQSATHSLDGASAMLAQRLTHLMQDSNKSMENTAFSLAQKLTDVTIESQRQVDGLSTGLSSRISEFTSDGIRKLESATGALSQRILETTAAFSVEADRLKTQSELTSSGMDQAIYSVRQAGETAYDIASRLGAQLQGLRETASQTASEIETGVGALSRMLTDLPNEAKDHAETLRLLVENQVHQISDLSARVALAFEQIQMIEHQRQAWASIPSLVSTPAPRASTPAPQNTAAPAPPPQAQPAPAQPAVAQASPSSSPGATPVKAALPPKAPAAEPMPRASGALSEFKSAGEPSSPNPAPSLSAPHGPAPQPPIPPSPTQRREPSVPLGMPPIAASAAALPPAPVGSVPPPPGTALPGPGANGNATHPEIKSWLGLAKRIVRLTGTEEGDASEPQRGWEMKQLLAAADQPGLASDTATATRHLMETLQAQAIDLDRLLEDEPPLDLLRRYRNGERNVFARRLVQVLGREQTDRVARKYRGDAEFRKTVDLYCEQFERLMDDAAARDREGIMAETFLTSQTGKVYLMLAASVGRIAT